MDGRRVSTIFNTISDSGWQDRMRRPASQPPGGAVPGWAPSHRLGAGPTAALDWLTKIKDAREKEFWAPAPRSGSGPDPRVVGEQQVANLGPVLLPLWRRPPA